ncbi:MAG: GntR family transcriptional regulator [Rhodobacteraceae bacterium]|nr:GntR family transcriptional regulator [Paracoccaceae bacterium]
MTGWEDIRAEVQARIRSGVWPLGSAIPHEEDLARDFGCARATVNRALRALAAQGVLERRRKGGTRVLAVPVRKATVSIPVIRAEVEATGRRYSHQIIWQATGQENTLHLETLHLADDKPYAHEVRVLHLAVLPPLPDLTAISINEWLVTTVSYATGEIAFSAAAADAGQARALWVPTGTPLFVITRETRNAAAQVITKVLLAHAPGYHLRTTM